jgi:hypothetical protein
MKVGEKVYTTEPQTFAGTMTDSAKGRKDDAGKPQMSLLSQSNALAAVTRVLEHGAQKYGRENWRKVSMARYHDAMCRHLNDYNGQVATRLATLPLDKDTNLPVLAHLIASALFLLEKELAFDKTRQETDFEEG